MVSIIICGRADIWRAVGVHPRLVPGMVWYLVGFLTSALPLFFPVLVVHEDIIRFVGDSICCLGEIVCFYVLIWQ